MLEASRGCLCSVVTVHVGYIFRIFLFWICHLKCELSMLIVEIAVSIVSSSAILRFLECAGARISNRVISSAIIHCI